MIQQKLAMLRVRMHEAGVDAYYIPTDDYHLSEYVGEHFAARKYISGFTGSAGVLLVTQNEAGLWTDGRYFLQAEAQLEGSGITLYKSGEPGVPTVMEFIKDKLGDQAVLGTDGRTISAALGKELQQLLTQKGAVLECDMDLVDEIWIDRPALPTGEAYLLDEKYTGKGAKEKLCALREKMDALGADIHVLSTLDDIAWLLNIRGNDVRYNPVVLCYAIIEKETGYLFIDSNKLNPTLRSYITGLNFNILPYNDIYSFVLSYEEGRTALLSSRRVNYALYEAVTERSIVIDAENPTLLMKAIKNETEIANLRRGHIKDGIAVTRFMKWLKENVGKIEMDEISAAAKLDSVRYEQEGNLGLSFNTICGYGPHGAIIHYSATPESASKIEPRGLLLVDSGGQYYEGTTDITRTFALGELTQTELLHFAATLKAMLSLASAKFLHGCTGANLDILARAPFWNLGLNYNHGTGHGIGYLLNVHEAPNGIHWRAPADRSCTFESGMVTSDEPGIYIANSHGVRLENELLCREGEKTPDGQFMFFETITCAPIDLDAVDPTLLDEIDRTRLNSYHEYVFSTLSLHLSEEERTWLKHYTRAV